MEYTSDPESNELVAALVAAFPIYLRRRLATLGVAARGAVLEALNAGIADLAGSLEALAKLSPHDQVKSPLELVRDATAPVTKVLGDLRVAAPDRDEWAAEIHPEDTYDLYPASSRDLGEEAWQLHLAWGIDKARVVAGMIPAAAEPPAPTISGLPSVALFGVDPDRRDELISALRERGYRSLVWRNPAALATASVERPAIVFVDLSHPAAHDAIRTLVADGIRVVAVAERVDDLATAGIMALGADEVLDLRRVVGRLDHLVPRLV